MINLQQGSKYHVLIFIQQTNFTNCSNPVPKRSLKQVGIKRVDMVSEEGRGNNIYFPQLCFFCDHSEYLGTTHE